MSKQAHTPHVMDWKTSTCRTCGKKLRSVDAFQECKIQIEKGSVVMQKCEEYTTTDCCDHHYHLQSSAEKMLETLKLITTLSFNPITAEQAVKLDQIFSLADAAIRTAEGRQE